MLDIPFPLVDLVYKARDDDMLAFSLVHRCDFARSLNS